MFNTTAEPLNGSTVQRFNSSTSQPLNVVLFVMESVGARYVELCGAPYRNTPELVHLAERAVTFDRIYASHPCTSSAIAGIFCSVYPYHGWRAIPPRAPGLNVPGLADVLAGHGYRTAFLHTGDLRFDHQGEFLRRHGFEQVADVAEPDALLGTTGSNGIGPSATLVASDFLSLPDRLLRPAALKWIDSDRSRPFFLTLWTIETHHPYLGAEENAPNSPRPSLGEGLGVRGRDRGGPSASVNFGSVAHTIADPYFNRYLGAIRSTDALIGELARELEARGLAESTLIVVLGDHGDAFGQHGHRAHGQTLYEDEVRIPILLVNPGLFPRAERISRVGQQIDIGPTVLDLIGLPTPPEWQGTSLFATDRPDRAYLFTGFHHYLFGFVEGNFKYIYDATTDRRELYDLGSDPAEQRNLIRSPQHADRASEAHRRLAAWLSYQNNYLAGFISTVSDHRPHRP